MRDEANVVMNCGMVGIEEWWNVTVRIEGCKSRFPDTDTAPFIHKLIRYTAKLITTYMMDGLCAHGLSGMDR